jgi:hypothetical protein
MIAGGLEVAVVGAVLRLAVHRDLGRVKVRHDPLRGIEGFRLDAEFAVDAGQAAEVLLLGHHLRLNRLRAGGQGGPTIPGLLGSDQPESRILREPLGVVDILIARDAAVYGPAKQTGQRELGVLPVPRTFQAPCDDVAEAQTFLQLTDQNESTIRSNARSEEIDLQRRGPSRGYE